MSQNIIHETYEVTYTTYNSTGTESTRTKHHFVNLANASRFMTFMQPHNDAVFEEKEPTRAVTLQEQINCAMLDGMAAAKYKNTFENDAYILYGDQYRDYVKGLELYLQLENEPETVSA